MSHSEKTERPTEQRRKKAREQGQIARSRELSGALACAAAVWLIAILLPKAISGWRTLFTWLLDAGSNVDVTTATVLLKRTSLAALAASAPLLLALFCVAGFSIAAQGGLTFSAESLAPKLERIGPGSRLRQIFSLLTVSSLLKSLVPGIVITILLVTLLSRDWRLITTASASPFGKSVSLLGNLLLEFAWKSALVMLVWSAVDYVLARQKLEGELRMTKEEVREELKQTEGNPATKARIRRIQRQARRARMMKAVEEATVVVTNPTHFAVALKYTPAMSAPVVVAKGQNLLAQELKRKAYWLGIAVVENKPLAQTLYRTVEVGRTIPADLYAAVAEVLAFVFRMQAASASITSPGGSH